LRFVECVSLAESGVGTDLTFDTEPWISSTRLHSTTTNPSQLALVSSGVWLLIGHVTWITGGSTAGDRRLRLLANSTTVLAETLQRAALSESGQAVMTMHRFSDTATVIKLEAWQNSGSTLSVAASTVYAIQPSPVLSAVKLR
jgi:hypothetical protein